MTTLSSLITHPDGSKVVSEYDSGGSLIRTIGRAGLAVEYKYDSQGRVLEENYIPREGSSPYKKQKYHYFRSLLISEEDTRGTETAYTYDDLCRVTSICKKGRKTELSYDNMGRLATIKKWKTDTMFTLLVNDYDAAGNVIEERVEDETGKQLLKKQYTYTENGEIEKVIGYPHNKETVLISYEYDSAGQLVSVEKADHQKTTIQYEDAYIIEIGCKGEKRTIIDPSGSQTIEWIGPNGNIVKSEVCNSQGKVLSLKVSVYDVSENLAHQSIKASSLKSGDIYNAQWSWNENGNLISTAYGKGSSNEFAIEYAYNRFGELEKEYRSGFEAPIEYRSNSKGQLQEIKHGTELKYTLEYDRGENLKQISLSSGQKIQLDFDHHDNLTKETIVDVFGSYSVAYKYDGEGKVTQISLPDGSFISYTYEGPFVKSIQRFDQDHKEQYTYSIESRDLMGNILTESLPGHAGSRMQAWDHYGRKVGIQTDFFEDCVPKGCHDYRSNTLKRQITMGNEESTLEYRYDSLNQLTSEKGELELEYQYDLLGNRIQNGYCSCSFNSANQTEKSGGITYTYGPNGVVATKTAGGQTWTYKSNVLGHITSIQCPDQTTLSFTYIPGGKRLAKRIEKKGRPSKTLRFFYLGDEEIGSIDEKGVIRELKIPSDPNAERSPSISHEIEGEIYVPLQGLQGNIACLVDPQRRKIVESYSYSAFGEERIFNSSKKKLTHSKVGNPWRYQEKRKDEEHGLIYFGARYYDPEAGRWMSPDPLGPVDGLNLYKYVKNNPLKYTDPFGLASEEKAACKCGHCVRGEFCHCRGQDSNNSIGACVCHGIDCCHKNFTILKQGSSFNNAIGAVAHGVVDFVIGSAQDFQTLAMHMGSGDTGLSLDERIQMLEMLEANHTAQLSAVGGWDDGASFH